MIKHQSDCGPGTVGGQRVAGIIRPAVAADAARIAELHTASWRSAYWGILSPEYLEDRVALDHSATWRQRLQASLPSGTLTLVAEPAAAVEGFIHAVPNADRIWGTLIENLHIDPNFRGRGLGSLLIISVAKALCESHVYSGVFLWIYSQNLRACRFYQRQGARVGKTHQILGPDGNMHNETRLIWDSVFDLKSQNS